MLLLVLLILASDELRQPEQVVGGAAEDEEPVDLGQTSQLYLGKWVGLLETAEGFLDQPAAAEADRIAGVSCQAWNPLLCVVTPSGKKLSADKFACTQM